MPPREASILLPDERRWHSVPVTDAKDVRDWLQLLHATRGEALRSEESRPSTQQKDQFSNGFTQLFECDGLLYA